MSDNNNIYGTFVMELILINQENSTYKQSMLDRRYESLVVLTNTCLQIDNRIKSWT